MCSCHAAVTLGRGIFTLTNIPCCPLSVVTGEASARLREFRAEFYPEGMLCALAVIDDGLRSVVLRALRMVPVIATSLYLMLDPSVSSADLTMIPGKFDLTRVDRHCHNSFRIHGCSLSSEQV